VRARVEALAQARGRSLNYILNEAVARYIDDAAWLIDEIAAAVAKADEPGAAVVAQDVVMADLDAVIVESRTRRAS